MVPRVTVTAFNRGRINGHCREILLQDISMCQNQVMAKISVCLHDCGLFPPSSLNALCDWLSTLWEMGTVCWCVKCTFGGVEMHP